MLPGNTIPTPTEGLERVYVDDARTHVVHARLERRDRAYALVILESPYGATSSRETVTHETTFASAWEANVDLAALEMRLAASGSYLRRVLPGGAWTRLSARPLDQPLAGHVVPLGPRSAAEFHLFRDRRAPRERALVSIPRVDLDAERFVLADLAFRFPAVEDGDLRILHARLAPAMLRSMLVRSHVELRTDGFAKLVSADDYHAAYGPAWREEVKTAFDRLAHRLLDSDLGAGHAPPQEEPPLPEGGLAAIRATLADTRLAQLRARFLPGDQEARLLAGDEITLRRWVAARRRDTPHAHQHLLSTIEAYLLTRLALAQRRGRLAEEESGRLARSLATLPLVLRLDGA